MFWEKKMTKYLIYIVFALFCLLVSLIQYFVKKKKIQFILFCSILLFYFLLSILKSSNVGTDSNAYYDHYYVIARDQSFLKIMNSVKPEFLYYGIEILFSKVLSLNKIFFDIFNFLIIVGCLFFAFRKFENSCVYLSCYLFIGFFCMSFSGIRQAMAMAICVLAMILFSKFNFKKRITKYLAYYLLNFCAIMFHVSSAICLLIPLIMLIKLKEYQIPWILLFFIPMCYIFPKLYILLSSFLDLAYQPWPSRISFKMIVIIVTIAIFYLIFYSKISDRLLKITKFERISFSVDIKNTFLLLFMCAALMSFNIATTTFTRLAMFFYLPQFYLYIKVCETHKNSTVKFLLTTTLLICFALYFVYDCRSWNIAPYEIR